MKKVVPESTMQSKIIASNFRAYNESDVNWELIQLADKNLDTEAYHKQVLLARLKAGLTVSAQRPKPLSRREQEALKKKKREQDGGA